MHIDLVLNLADYALGLILLLLLLFSLLLGVLAVVQRLLGPVGFESYSVLAQELFEQGKLYQTLPVGVELIEQELELFVIDILV